MKSNTVLHKALAHVERRRTLPCPAECRLLRLRAGLTLIEVAEHLGVTESSLSRYELGKRHPRKSVLDRYLETLEVLRHAKAQTA